jgi:hypothetical protein
MMSEKQSHHGRCFCGAVEFTVTGTPEAMAYCHCSSCRHWSAGPVHAFTLWQPTAFEVSRGREHVASFDANPGSDDRTVVSRRAWCTQCGGHLYVDHPTMGVIDVPAALLEAFTFSPAFHVHYAETVQPMTDGLPKFCDLPKPAGGSGIELPEIPDERL